MEPIIFERADIRELAREMIARGFCTGVNTVNSDVIELRNNHAAAIKYINLITMPCPQHADLTRSPGDYVQTGQGYQKTLIPGAMVLNAISTVLHEMHENCSIRPVCIAANDEFELREIEEMHVACEQIKNGDFEFVRDRAHDLYIDAAHLHINNEHQLMLTINGTENYRVAFRVYYGDQIIGQIN